MPTGIYIRTAPENRFIEKINFDGPLPQYNPSLGPCWIWNGATSGDGYARFTYKGLMNAHRFSYLAFVGAIPDGFEVDHLCRNRCCVRPSHLEAVTPKMNKQRSMNPTGINHRKTQCIRGHSLSDFYFHCGRRICKICHKAKTSRQRGALSQPFAN